MTKYIVKNCPALRKMVTINSSKGHETLFDVCSDSKHCLCKDRTDCPIKQVVELCMNYPEKPDNSLSNRILQTLQVEGGMMIFKVKATEVWEWEFEIEAESKEELEERLEDEFSELCSTDDATNYENDWTIEEVENDR